MNFLSFCLILRTYIKLVHNRPLQPNLSDTARNLQLAKKNRNLMLFIFVGAPLVIFSLKKSAVQLKDLGSVNVSIESSTESQINNSSNINNNNSSLFWLITTIYNKIPNWLKLLFSLLFITVFVLKLLGFSSSFVFLNNIFYLKIYIYISVVLAILFQLFEILMLYLFSTKKIKISEVLPDFVINWLKQIELVSTRTEYITEFKNSCYREIVIYLIIVIVFTIIS